MSAINITEAAHDYLADLLSKQSTPGIGIRIFITQPGTQYAETCIAYGKPGHQAPRPAPEASQPALDIKLPRLPLPKGN